MSNPSDRPWTNERTWRDDPNQGRWNEEPEVAWARGWNDAVKAYLATLPDPLAPVDGLTNSHSPETAHAAGRQRSHKVTWANDRGRILRLFAAYGWRTAAEMTPLVNRGRDPQMSRNQVASRLLELRQLGLVCYAKNDDGSVVVRSTGMHGQGRVQGLTAAGYDWLLAQDRERK